MKYKVSVGELGLVIEDTETGQTLGVPVKGDTPLLERLAERLQELLD